MRVRTWLAVAVVCGFVIAGIWAAEKGPMPREKRQQQWKKVDEAVSKGLPRTAIEHLEPIIAGAMADKAYPEAIKAIGRKIGLEGTIEGNKPEEKIVRLEAEIAKAPKQMVPMMEAVLAHWYWHYFQQNRWRFMQRTATAEAPGKDITTWDLPRIMAEIDRHFTLALSAAPELKQIKISEYDDLLVKGTMPDSYRPTLYDFVAHEALAFYSAGEQAGAKPEDTFEIMADSPIFAPAEEFLKWNVETTDTDSPKYKAIRLYQDLLRFHEKDEDRTAFLDADLHRLVFGYNQAVGEEKNQRYKDALKKWVDRWGDHEVSAVARFHWASVLQREGDLVEAHKLAKQGAQAFPNAVGGRMCHNLVQQIEAKQLEINTERVWNQPWPKIAIHYKNVTEVHFRIVRDDWVKRLESRRGRPEWLDQNDRKELLARKPDFAWSVKLPATDDFHTRTEEVAAPEDLKPGYYFVLASVREDFAEKQNSVSYTDVWISDLALVMRSRPGSGLIEGFVLDANSGEPVEGAEVKTWHRQQDKFAPGPTGKTNANGLFSIAGNERAAHAVLVTHHQQQLASSSEHYVSRGAPARPYSRTVFFTDRSLYRPGQTIRYKGICIGVNTEVDEYKVLAGETLTVIFADPNGKEIARQVHETNDYGSFSGSFTAPRDRLTGHMTIRVEGQPGGSTNVRVEEYKRPKFQVTLDAPKTAAKLNEKVSLQGKAMAYTGAAIDGAKVRWRVVRQVRFPIWWRWHYWWLPMPPTPSQEIAHGVTTTGVDGSFTVEFVARPDLSVSEKDEPIFNFTIYADVTDTAGETRSAQRGVNVGYTALQASLSAADWLVEGKPVVVTITTTTLDGEGQKAEGSLKVYRLKQPEKVQRARLDGFYYPMRPLRAGKPQAEPKPDPSNPDSWELGELVAEEGFTTDATGKASRTFKLAAGAYRAMLETQDRYGKKVTARLPLQVLDPDAKQFPIKVPNLVAAPKWALEPGEEFMALWGTGYEKARAFIEIDHRGKSRQAFWTELGATQQAVKQKVEEAMRGGFTLRVTMVRENRAYITERHVAVPWSNKDLAVKWERFVSKLEPGQKETFTAIITGPDAKKAAAEMVATLYDQSLDAYFPHNWMRAFGVFRQDYSRISSRFENMLKRFNHLYGFWPQDFKDTTITYRSFPWELTANLWGYEFFIRLGGGGLLRAGVEGAPPPAPGEAGEYERRAMNAAPADKRALDRDGVAQRKQAGLGADEGKGEGAPQAPEVDLSHVTARANLNETAFFFPHLVSTKDGEVRMEFTMPEALTQWKFMGFAHDAALRSGYLEDSVVTAKDLMVQPNPPRFLREGDVLYFTVKVTNQSAAAQKGSVRLTLADARTGKPVDAALGNTQTDQPFDIPSKESRSFSWKLTVPDGLGPVIYKAVGSTGRLSDGEEGMLPVLARRVMVTESLPLPIRGPATKKFTFEKLVNSGKSDTLRHETLTVQMASNPSWYAVMALPYLMESPHECTEQVFNRLYANALARHIATSDPKIRRIFDQWKGTPALDSPLEKNQDLKAVLLEETPWVRQAEAESQARRNVGILFDDNRLNDETARNLRKLAEMQLPDGAWPWFPGGPPNDYITLYITTGFGRLRHLGVKVDVAPAIKSLERLDAWIDRVYREVIKHAKPDECYLSPTIALYLYGRSFFLEDKKIDPKHKEAVDYFLDQARKHWLKLAHRKSQAHLAIALKRFGDLPKAREIMASIKERAVSNEEMGMFWRDLELSWWWFRAPIETQAVMIEAFDEVVADAQAVEECKVWLLKQKQTQDWKTTKATADAIYALLLRGENLLASDALVEVTLADVTIKPEKVEAGTGFYEQRFVRGEIRPAMGEVTVKKVDKGVAWGSLHWQYLEDVAKITPHEATPLKVTKTLYTREHTKKGPVLQPVKGAVKVGDELVVRIVIRVDRDMEYVHLKDHRGSGTEPVNVLSRYKYQDGLAYYESTKDTATHFFIDYLPKGTYVFEYPVRVVHRGQYQTGMANIQCMYAPEFNSHSESIPLVVD